MTHHSRRELLRLIAAGTVAGAAVPLITSCGNALADERRTATGTETGTSDTVMVIRHAEKPQGSHIPYGITADGQRSDGSLTVRGWNRAGALAELFSPGNGRPLRDGLVRPTAIFASRPNGDASQRPSQTVIPLAAKLGLTLDTSHGKGEEKELMSAVTATKGAVLVSWQHEEIPAIVTQLGTVRPAPPAHWADDRFDMVWVFTRTTGGWAFSQVAQLLLDGDRAGPI